MAKAHTEWKVIGHEPIVKLAQNLWWVRGNVPGMTLKRTMTVARLNDGGLVIHNAIALDAPAMRELEAFGTPRFLLVPSSYHRLDAPAYKRRFPQLVVLGPNGSRKGIEQVIALDGTYEDFPARQELSLCTLRGTKEREGAMLVRSSDGTTVVLNDVVFNMDKKEDLLGYLFTTLLGSAPGPRVSRLSKLALIADRPEFRAELERFAALPDLVRLIVAHEKVASGADARAALESACTYL
jgi:hypothetical protein